MAVPMAYGDSATFWATNAANSRAEFNNQMAQTRSHAHLQQASNQLMSQSGLGLAQFTAWNAPSAMTKEQSSTKVIADRGFGGAEARPRARRYAR